MRYFFLIIFLLMPMLFLGKAVSAEGSRALPPPPNILPQEIKTANSVMKKNRNTPSNHPLPYSSCCAALCGKGIKSKTFHCQTCKTETCGENTECLSRCADGYDLYHADNSYVPPPPLSKPSIALSKVKKRQLPLPPSITPQDVHPTKFSSQDSPKEGTALVFPCCAAACNKGIKNAASNCKSCQTATCGKDTSCLSRCADGYDFYE